MLRKTLLLMVLAGLTLPGCTNFNCCDSSIIEVIPSSVTLIDAMGNTAPVDVSSGVVWRVIDKPDWVTLPMDGPQGLITIAVTGTTNSTGAARTGTVTFMAANGDKATLTVKQARTYTVTYNANAGGAAVLSFPLSQIKTHDLPLSLSGGGATPPTRTDFAFIGWNTAANGSGTYYAAGAMYTANADITLYAQWSGDGSATAPKLITTNIDLAALATRVNNITEPTGLYYKLISDIDLSDYGVTNSSFNGGNGWVPIGDNNDGTINTRFRGNLDGNGHIISKLSINNPADYLGLFGIIYDGSVQNVNLANTSITGNEFIGGVAGNISVNSSVSGCFVDGYVSGVSYVGGVSGYVVGANSKLTNCGSSATVISYSVAPGTGIQIGGIVGEINIGGYVANCYASGNISGGSQVGGVVGLVYGGTLTNCYATGNINGLWRVGGVAGGSFGTVTYCYATGDVTGNMYAGGVIGAVIVLSSPFQAGILTNCVALNHTITSITADIGRLAGDIFTGTTLDKNWTWADMIFGNSAFTNTYGFDKVDGQSVTNINAKDNNWWISTAGWAFGTSDAAPWVWNSTLMRPVLYWE